MSDSGPREWCAVLAAEKQNREPAVTDTDPPGEYVPQPPEDAEAPADGAPIEAPQEAEIDVPPPDAPAVEDAAAALGEAVAERFAAGAGSLLNAPFHARVAGVAPQTLGEFLSGVRAPTCCNGLRLGGAAPAGWVDLDREFAFVCIDRLLGGPVDQAYLPDRPLTAIERTLLRRVLSLFAESLRAAWPDGAVGPVELAEGWGCRPPEGPMEAQAVVTVRFEVALSAQVGLMRLCVVISALEGLPLPRRVSSTTNAGPMELCVDLPEIRAAADELAGLAPGDIITTDTPVDGEVVVRLAGIPAFGARLGVSGVRRAVTLTRKLAAENC